jgi:hypothetical protein
MLIDIATGRLGVQMAREASRSALPDAPVVREPERRPSAFRIRTAGALHRVADRIGPVDARAGHGPLRQA